MNAIKDLDMTKPPSNWRGRNSRDDLHLDDPYTLRETLIVLAFIGMLAVTILVGTVCVALGAMQ